MTRVNVKGFILILICFAWYIQVFSQNNTVYSVGDKFPLQTLISLLRQQGYQNLSEKEFEHKCLLIDFWNIWCHSCWKGMQKIDDLQKQFKNDLIIVKITANKKKEIEVTARKMKISPSPVLSLTDDSTMTKFFPHLGDPLHLWIDKSGIIRHSAYDYNATSQNIAAFVRDQNLDLSLRGDLGRSEEPKSLLENAGTSLAGSVASYSIFVKGMHEYASLTTFERKTPQILPPALCFYQVSLLDLFRAAYFKEVYGFDEPRFFFGNNRIVLTVKDSLPFFKQTDSNKIDSWNNQYLLSYEAADVGIKSPLKSLQFDLQKYFPYRASVETRNVLCRVLIWKSNTHRFLPQVKQTGKEYEFKNDNVPFQSFYKSLLIAAQQDSKPLLSDVDWNEPVSMHFQSKLEDVLKEKKELRSYGFDIVEEIRPVKVLVIEDEAEKRK